MPFIPAPKKAAVFAVAKMYPRLYYISELCAQMPNKLNARHSA